MATVTFAVLAALPSARPATVSMLSLRPRPVRAVASWYGPRFHTKKTANGERFDQQAMTCAHRRLALGTILLVRNPETGLQVVLRVNDRGPYIHGRDLDVSMGAADALGFRKRGLASLELTVLKPDRTGLLVAVASPILNGLGRPK